MLKYRYPTKPKKIEIAKVPYRSPVKIMYVPR